MCPEYDFHIHTKYLGCADSTMEIESIVRECKNAGVRKIGITDHLWSVDSLSKHIPILEDIKKIESAGIDVYFGAEVHFTGCCKEFLFNEEIKQKYGFQFAIGGIHNIYVDEYDVKKIIDIQHRHHLLTCENTLVDVLVHPYWFMKYEFDKNNWDFIDTMKVIPKGYIRELGQVAKETGTAIEINSCMLSSEEYKPDFIKEYIEYIALLAEEKPMFSFGSDAHNISKLNRIKIVWEVVDSLGIQSEQIWMPICKPVKS